MNRSPDPALDVASVQGAATYVGIDPSLTATGFVVLNGDGELVEARTLTSSKRGVERLLDLRQQVRSLVAHYKPDLVAVEGYSFGSKGRSVFSIAEWGGVLRVLLVDLGREFVDVAPAEVKKFAAGKGSVGKPQMAVAVYKRWGVEFEDDNQVDAYVLARMAWAMRVEAQLTKPQQEALRKLEVVPAP